MIRCILLGSEGWAMKSQLPAFLTARTVNVSFVRKCMYPVFKGMSSEISIEGMHYRVEIQDTSPSPPKLVPANVCALYE